MGEQNSFCKKLKLPCALSCKTNKMKGLPCHMFRYQTGKCSMTGDLLPSTIEDESVTIYGETEMGKSELSHFWVRFSGMCVICISL